MEIKNVIISELPNGLLRLTPEKGYILQDKISKRMFLKADIEPKDINNWRAVEIEQ